MEYFDCIMCIFWFYKFVNGVFVVLLVFCFCIVFERLVDIKVFFVSNIFVMVLWKLFFYSNGIFIKYNVYVYNSIFIEVCM